MTSKEKFIEAFCEEVLHQYATKYWCEQEYVPPCNDTISRKEAIKSIREQFSYGECYCDEYSIVGLINNLPPVIPNLKIGHWIDGNENEIDARYGKHIYRCSECDKYADKFVAGSECWWDAEKPNYCPNCGAKMESEDKNEQKAKEKA